MFILPQLSFNKSDLAPIISEETLSFHHEKHHAGYIAKLNESLIEHPELLEMKIVDLIKNYKNTPENLHTSILNNGGQHYNHSMYWESITPKKDTKPAKELISHIEKNFGSYDEFVKLFSQAGITQFGSGWVWLSVDINGELVIDKTLNADTPLLHGKTPILTMDVWEHAYYLDYQNRRPDYIASFMSIVNWEEVSRKYSELI
jgi:superoxide dismutase, Fe-Mn family